MGLDALGHRIRVDYAPDEDGSAGSSTTSPTTGWSRSTRAATSRWFDSGTESVP